ncbi:DUF4320 family protein [Paenibacillus popilliae]|uniref:Cellobiose phosphorylase n=1 Tax=Paenibacillus popilliae ATCC 14706 TaxID=1212764 RepID=M9M053_PAEPP|nr:DUF4320 family protein [Paenibacillus popilliae]GAC42084.1 cellobiose phosphorylase [Paenibacillus popilliae ATCC 14706]
MNKALNIIKNERGDILGLGTFLGLLVATIIIFAAIEFYGMIVTYDKLKLAGEDTLELMKAQNGFNGDLGNKFYNIVEKLGLDRTKVEVTGTIGPVQRGEIIELHASTPYSFIAFRPFGQELTSDIKINLSGLARTYLRD